MQSETNRASAVTYLPPDLTAGIALGCGSGSSRLRRKNVAHGTGTPRSMHQGTPKRANTG
jgi:hypothetical protein